MIFSLAIYAAPYSSQTSQTAYEFATAVLRQGHVLHRVFFYHDGVHNATSLAAPPQDEFNLHNAWDLLAKEHDLVICIAAALKRGVLNKEEADRYNKSTHNLNDNFALSGLGQLIEAAVISDRLITFG
uniref:sulfurtransferase complex subunit TusD n=1 Tax=Cellvibrio fontiphilus TaxID=1815559 RepID=UPI002B4BD58D|nr:sulfurtransferase complex subunit TusD [Cellvibrio fontiphilus]